MFTNEELKNLEMIKCEAASRLDVNMKRPWSHDTMLAVMKSNVCTIPIQAARMISKGEIKVARAMLNRVLTDLQYIEGMENGEIEYRSPDFYDRDGNLLE